MTPGAATWLALLGTATALAVASVVLPALRAARPDRVVALLLSSRAARIVLVLLWAEAGYHVFCQRP